MIRKYTREAMAEAFDAGRARVLWEEGPSPASEDPNFDEWIVLWDSDENRIPE